MPSTALITGASSGIGLDLARLVAADGNNVVLVARSGDKLAELAAELESKHHIRAFVAPIDLADPGAPEELYHVLEEQGIAIDILINNAGFGTHGPFAEADLAAQMQMLQVNVAALTQLTWLFLQPMIRRKQGRIMNVASTAAFQPGPFMAVYYASKAYLLSFSEALANELHGTGVTVTTLCPGPTITGFQHRAGLEGMGIFRTAAVVGSRP